MIRRIVQVLLGGVLVAAVISVGTFVYILSFYTATSSESHDCAVVFGAAVWPGGEPSHALSDRINTAIDAYENEQVSCLVFSGADSAYGKHEVDVMLDVAYERGVQLEDLELDYEGTNTQKTVENLSTDRSYLLVSNDFHLARINLFAQRAELDFALEHSRYEHGRYRKEAFFLFREAVAFWYYMINI